MVNDGGTNKELNFDNLILSYAELGNSNPTSLVEEFWQDYIDIINNKDNYMITFKIKLTAVEYNELSEYVLFFKFIKYILLSVKSYKSFLSLFTI